jgi:hypothetical protein
MRPDNKPPKPDRPKRSNMGNAKNGGPAWRIGLERVIRRGRDGD